MGTQEYDSSLLKVLGQGNVFIVLLFMNGNHFTELKGMILTKKGDPNMNVKS